MIDYHKVISTPIVAREIEVFSAAAKIKHSSTTLSRCLSEDTYMYTGAGTPTTSLREHESEPVHSISNLEKDFHNLHVSPLVLPGNKNLTTPLVRKKSSLLNKVAMFFSLLGSSKKVNVLEHSL